MLGCGDIYSKEKLPQEIEDVEDIIRELRKNISETDDAHCYTLLQEKAGYQAVRRDGRNILDFESSKMIEKEGKCKFKYTIFAGQGMIFYNNLGGAFTPEYWCIKNKNNEYKVVFVDDVDALLDYVPLEIKKENNPCKDIEYVIDLETAFTTASNKFLPSL